MLNILNTATAAVLQPKFSLLGVGKLLILLRTMYREIDDISYFIDGIQSLRGTIKPLLNSLRLTVSESTFVFYSS